jgi:hypothetical protein
VLFEQLAFTLFFLLTGFSRRSSRVKVKKLRNNPFELMPRLKSEYFRITHPSRRLLSLRFHLHVTQDLQRLDLRTSAPIIFWGARLEHFQSARKIFKYILHAVKVSMLKSKGPPSGLPRTPFHCGGLALSIKDNNLSDTEMIDITMLKI